MIFTFFRFNNSKCIFLSSYIILFVFFYFDAETEVSFYEISDILTKSDTCIHLIQQFLYSLFITNKLFQYELYTFNSVKVIHCDWRKFQILSFQNAFSTLHLLNCNTLLDCTNYYKDNKLFCFEIPFCYLVKATFITFFFV